MSELFLSVINAVFSLAGSLANGLVLFVFFSDPNLRVGANFFVASLAMADLVVCAICQTCYIYYLNVPWSSERFTVFKTVSYVGLHASFGNLLLLTTHRFIALRRPFSHWMLFRGKTIVVCVVCVWVSSLAMALVFSLTVVSSVSVYFHLVMLTGFIFTHAHILLIVHKQRRQINRQHQSLAYNHIIAGIRSEHVTTGTLAMLCGTSLLLFLPDLFVEFLKLEDSVRFRATFTSMFVNSFLNPCIYVWRGKRFRNLLCKTARILPTGEVRGRRFFRTGSPGHEIHAISCGTRRICWSSRGIHTPTRTSPVNPIILTS